MPTNLARLRILGAYEALLETDRRTRAAGVFASQGMALLLKQCPFAARRFRRCNCRDVVDPTGGPMSPRPLYMLFAGGEPFLSLSATARPYRFPSAAAVLPFVTQYLTR